VAEFDLLRSFALSQADARNADQPSSGRVARRETMLIGAAAESSGKRPARRGPSASSQRKQAPKHSRARLPPALSAYLGLCGVRDSRTVTVGRRATIACSELYRGPAGRQQIGFSLARSKGKRPLSCRSKSRRAALGLSDVP
jgi:hypothetical protein